MVIDICIGAISVAFVVLVIYLVITLHKVNGLLKTSNDLALDLKDKSKTLNVFFHPLKFWNKKKAHPNWRRRGKIGEILTFIADGMLLFNKLKKKNLWRRPTKVRKSSS